jgi:transposase
MLGQNPTQQQPSLFSYCINLEQRVGPQHPLRQINSLLDLSFVVPAVRDCYGRSGNVSIDPVVILKLMFLLFYYNIPSERELMEQLACRIDFLWFLGYNLDTPIPDHSVLSKARARWGAEVFKNLFVRTVQQCVQAGLVDGRLLHIDSTIVKANAAKDSITPLPAFLTELYEQQERKLEALPAIAPLEPGPGAPPVVPSVPLALYDPAKLLESSSPSWSPKLAACPPKLAVMDPEPRSQAVEVAEPRKDPAQRISLTDPDAQLTRAKNGLVELSYKEHRLVDDAHGVITAVELTRAQVHDGTRLAALTQQHEHNTQIQAGRMTLTGDQHYGTIDNYRYCHQRGICAHMAPAGAHLIERGNFPVERFTYEPQGDRFACPAGHYLTRLQDRPELQHVVYRISQAPLCHQCPLRDQCTRGKSGRTLIRHYDQSVLDQQRQQALGPAGRYSRQRRKHKVEGSFADAANNHGLKRARWRRLWRQQIQTWMICAVQNLRLLLTRSTTGGNNGIGGAAVMQAGDPNSASDRLKNALAASWPRWNRQGTRPTASRIVPLLYQLWLLPSL